MPGYDSEAFDPPAPFAEVLLRNPETGAEISPVRMLIDTGADVTLVPHAAAAQIGCRLITAHNLSGFDGASGAYDEVSLEMVFLEKSFAGQFLMIDQPTGIIGRNILNYLVLTFDGPRLTWSETKR
jgi:predicted aspartyl protease